MVATVIVNISLKPDQAEAYCEQLKTVLPETRAFDGCLGIDAYRRQHHPEQMVLIERWESKAHYKAYLAWRQSTGIYDRLPDSLTEPMQIKFLEHVL